MNGQSAIAMLEEANHRRLTMLSITSGQTNKAAYLSLRNLNARTRLGIDRAFREERRPMKEHTITGPGGFSANKHGRWYLINDRTRKAGPKAKLVRRWHHASKNTETPAIMTGDLNRSLHFIIKKGSMMTYGANTPYAKIHEKSKRQYILRTIEKRKQILGINMGHSIRKEIMRKR